MKEIFMDLGARRSGRTYRLIQEIIRKVKEEGDASFIYVRDHYNTFKSNLQLLDQIKEEIHKNHPDLEIRSGIEGGRIWIKKV